MQPGSILIKKCPHCLKLIKQDITGSGNTFGATYWTDGKMEAPMLAEIFELVQCPICEKHMWIDELDVISKINPSSVMPDEFKEAEYFLEPHFEEYIRSIDFERISLDKQRHVRIRAWWEKNDRRRRIHPITSRETANLQALADILGDINAEDLLMKAEIMRELGRYGEALILLNKIVDDNFSNSVEILKGLCERRDPFVRNFKF